MARQGIRDSIPGTWVLGLDFWNSMARQGIWDSIPGTWASGLNIWNSIFSIWDSGLNIRHLGFGTQNQELLDIWNSGFRTQCLELGFLLKTVARRCIQSLGGVSMTDSEGLWPQLVCCAPHLSTVPLISDKVQ